MIAITSIPPVHKNGDHIQNCIATWFNQGYEVHSLNHKEEIEILAPLYPKVKFFPTQRTHKAILGKHYVLISALIDHAKDQDSEHFLFINADVEIYDPYKIQDKLKEWSNDAVIVMHREDYLDDVNMSSRYALGLDGFFINKKFLDIYPQSLMCMGQCFWDYWIPFKAKRSGVKVYSPTQSYLFHKEHTAQYNDANWRTFGEIFMHENGLEKNFKGKGVGAMSFAVHREIITNYTSI